MTLYVHYEGTYPERLACGTCMCEVTVLGQPDYLAYDMEKEKLGHKNIAAGYRPIELGESPAHAPNDCSCRCHESARRFLRNMYDPV